MEKVNQKRIKKLEAFVKKNGWIKIMILCGLDDATVCKQWIKRQSIPSWHWEKIIKLINKEVQVEISII